MNCLPTRHSDPPRHTPRPPFRTVLPWTAGTTRSDPTTRASAGRRTGTAAPLLALGLALAACGGTGEDAATDDVAGEDSVTRLTDDNGSAGARPPTRSDTVRIEGMAEPISLRLFTALEDFPLPFTAYVPEEMAAQRASESAVDFIAEFGGTRSEDAFVHLYVFPEETDRQAALAAAKAYKTGRGIPISQGLEIIADATLPPHLRWAEEAYRFRYQSVDRWYAGTLGVGRKGDRYFMIVRHRPAEYGDGFGPRADLITETWRWWDGTGLQDRAEPVPPVPDDPTPGA